MEEIIGKFKTTRRTNRFKEGQNIRIVYWFGNHFHIKYQYRGYGRRVHGRISSHSPIIGKIVWFGDEERTKQRNERRGF